MRRVLVICAGLMLARAAVAAPVPVTTCGQIVETGRAELVQDLSCDSSASTAAVAYTPALRGTSTCDTSCSGIGSWGVCTND